MNSFANVAQSADLPGWLTLGQVSIVPGPAKPSLHGSLSPSGFDLDVSNAAPGAWAVQGTSDFLVWTQLLTTNTSTSGWRAFDQISSSVRFYRVVGSQ